MLRHCSCVGLVVVVAGVLGSGTAHAQGGGRGGFGMGGAGGMGPFGLAAMESVQKEIGLEGDGLAKVKKVVSSFQEDMRSEREKAGLPGPGGFQNLSQEELTAVMEKMNTITKNLNEKFLPQLKEALTPAQFERVQQIQWQLGGSQALMTPELSKMLDITNEQQGKIKAINQEYQAKFRDLGFGGGGNFQEVMAKRQELTKERDGKAGEVLTKDQQEKYTKLKGKPFDLALLRQGPGPRGGGQ